MNKRPVSYLQTDPRWKDLPYQVPGETATIGGSGCGPTAAAMLIETLTGKTFTPVDACKWSVEHGYKAKGQGTYYGYFAPQFEAFGIKCWQLSWTNVYHNPASKVHDQALEYLKQGYYLIALMKQGTWTSGGHFIVVWWADGKIRINDPASTMDSRVNGDINTFRNEAAYYWVVDARAYNQEDDIVSYDKFKEYMDQYRQELGAAAPAPWAAPYISKCIDAGIMSEINGAIDRPGDFLTRQEAAVMHALALETGKTAK
ncbi:C39 family peptidase [Lawsonibacter sp. JLR.KK007]|uniref:C39 family peptidase n=1 Tax=Lawsonibacter sp. JLR.KK007 TaxID=3114293 RepID=UPI002FF25B25